MVDIRKGATVDKQDFTVFTTGSIPED